MQRNSSHISCFLSGKCQNACNDSIQAAQYGCLHVLWQSDMDTMTHISAGAQQVFLATWSSVCVCVFYKQSPLRPYACARSVQHWHSKNNLFLSVSMCLSPTPHPRPSLDPSFPSLSLFLPNTFNPPVSLHPTFVFRSLFVDLASSVIAPLFHPSLHPESPSVTFYLWHIMHVLLQWCQRTDRSATMCVILLEEGEEEDWGGGHIDRKWPAEPQTALLS